MVEVIILNKIANRNTLFLKIKQEKSTLYRTPLLGQGAPALQDASKENQRERPLSASDFTISRVHHCSVSTHGD